MVGSLINTIKEERVTLEAKKLDVELETETFKALIKGQDYNDFPIIPSIKEENGLEMKIEALKEALSQLENSAMLSETYPEISGVYWDFKKGGVELVATDSFRLGKKEMKLEVPESLIEKGFILPLRAAQELLHIIMDSNQESAVTIYFNENQVLFLFEDIYIISRLLSGAYPNYKDLIPQGFNLEVMIDKEELANSIKLVRVFSPKTSDIKVEITESALKLSAKTQTGSSESLVPADIQGSGVSELMFNHRYLLDGLSNIKEKKISITFKNEASPALFRGQGEESYLYVVMPLKS